MTTASDAPDLVIPAPPQASLPVRGAAARFPLRRVYCVGRNYAAHAIEMGHDPDREAPFFFQKNPDNLISDGADFPYPPMTGDVHHEIELLVALSGGGRDIAAEDALGLVFGYATALDMTRRDVQAGLKKAGRPWEAAKAFEHSAPCSALVPAREIGHPAQGAIWLKVNDELRQEGDLNQMIWKTAGIIAELSRHFTLAPGDVIMTGTPAGVGPVQRGDVLHGHIEGIGALHTRVI